MDEIKVGDRVRYTPNDIMPVNGRAGKVINLFNGGHDGFRIPCATVEFEKRERFERGFPLTNLEKIANNTDERDQRIAALEAERDELRQRNGALALMVDATVKERDELRALLQEAEETTVYISGITFEAARNPVFAAYAKAIAPVHEASKLATRLHIKLLTTLASKK